MASTVAEPPSHRGPNGVTESINSDSALTTLSSKGFSDLTYAREIKAEEDHRTDAIATALELQKQLDESVRPYTDSQKSFTYYESSKASKAAKAKPSPVLRNSEEAEASATDDGTPPDGTIESDVPVPPTTNGAQNANDPSSGKYPFAEFIPIQNFEDYLSSPSDLSIEELIHRTNVVNSTMMALQREWDVVDKECYDWEEAEKAKAKTIADEAKAQAELEQSEEDARINVLQHEYKNELRMSRKEWVDGFSKSYLEIAENDSAEAYSEAQTVLDLLNKIRDPLFMKGFSRRQRALLNQKWDSRLVEKPLPETKQTKEERDLEDRKRRRLTDRITFDDMNRADAYGYTYNPLDLARGDQKLPNLRVVAKVKENKRAAAAKQVETNGDTTRPKRSTRKGAITESGENSEADSASEEEPPLPEKRRGRGQTTKFIDTMNSGTETGKKAAKTYVGEDGVRRYVGSNKPSGRPAATPAAPAKGRGKIAPKSKLDQMSRAVSEGVEEFNSNNKRRIEGDEGDDAARAKRTKTFIQQPQLYFPQPIAPLPSINSMLNPEPQSPAPPPKRRRGIAAKLSTPTLDTAENTGDDEEKPAKKPRNKTEHERAVQSAAMKANWSNPNGKMRMGIERRNRRAARRKYELARVKNGGIENPTLVYKSDEDGFDYAYFGETPPAPAPVEPSPVPITAQTSLSASASVAPSAPDTTGTNTPVGEEEDELDENDVFLDAPPVKKTRVGRVSKPSAKSFGSFDGALDEYDDEAAAESSGDSGSQGKRKSTEPLYQTFQKITSPNGHNLGKRVSKPRMKLHFGTTTDEDGEEEEEVEEGDTDEF